MDNRKRTPGLAALLGSPMQPDPRLSRVEMRVREALQLQEPEEDLRPGTALARKHRGSFAARLRERGGGCVRVKVVMLDTSKAALMKLAQTMAGEDKKASEEEIVNQTCDTLPSSLEVMQSLMKKYKRKTGSVDLRLNAHTPTSAPIKPHSTISQLSTATHTRTHSLSLSPGKALSPIMYQFARSQTRCDSKPN